MKNIIHFVFEWSSLNVLMSSFFFFFFFFFFILLKAINKQINISKGNKTRLTQNNRNTQEMQDKWMNHLKKYFSFQTGDLEGEEAFFFWDFCLGG